MVKNPPANAGDMGSIPGLEDPTYCRATRPMHPNYWSLSALEPGLLGKRSHHGEDQHGAAHAQGNWGEAPVETKTEHSQKYTTF